MVWTGRGAAVLLLALVACAPAKPSQNDIAAAALAPLKARYPNVIMGFDVHGTSVNVSIDLQALDSMDEDKEDAMDADALRTWAKTWHAEHPKSHAKLTMHIIDFRGNQVTQASISV